MTFARAGLTAAICLLALVVTPGSSPADQPGDATIVASIPTLNTENRTVNEAYRIAIGDLMGNPIKALSTNCLYYNAYLTAEKMAKELKVAVDPQWSLKAERLKKAINARLWDESRGCYRFLIGSFGNCDHQEGLGSSYALLFGIADPKQAESVFAHQHVTPAGLPCGWPNLPRYERPDGMSFGRHMGTVWPQIQGFWAEAAARAAHADVFSHEFFNLVTHAVRDKHFAEIYHPLTGMPYGGLQENQGQGIILWQATSRQTWAATAYLRMVLLGLVGMRFDTDGIRFEPCVPTGISSVDLRNVRYRRTTIDVMIRGTGTKVKQCLLNGKAAEDYRLSAQAEGPQKVSILLTTAEGLEKVKRQPSRAEKRKPTKQMRPLGSHYMVDENGIIWDGDRPVGIWGVNGRGTPEGPRAPTSSGLR